MLVQRLLIGNVFSYLETEKPLKKKSSKKVAKKYFKLARKLHLRIYPPKRHNSKKFPRFPASPSARISKKKLASFLFVVVTIFSAFETKIL
jgi:hypothetical protein